MQRYHKYILAAKWVFKFGRWYFAPTANAGTAKLAGVRQNTASDSSNEYIIVIIIIKSYMKYIQRKK